MRRARILFAVGLCANVLVALPAMAQAPAEVTLTRIDCGTGATPTDVGQRFSDTFAYKDLKLTFALAVPVVTIPVVTVPVAIMPSHGKIED